MKCHYCNREATNKEHLSEGMAISGSGRGFIVFEEEDISMCDFHREQFDRNVAERREVTRQERIAFAKSNISKLERRIAQLENVRRQGEPIQRRQALQTIRAAQERLDGWTESLRKLEAQS